MKITRFLTPVVKPVESLIYRLCGVRAADEMGWKTYAVAFLVFNLLGALVVYALQRLQDLLPLNPQKLGAVSADSSFNTAISFATNTNWQGYGGETTMSYLTQMLGLTVQNFVSAALCITFGRLVGDERQGWAVLIAMSAIFVVLTGVAIVAEQGGNPKLASLGVDQVASATQSGGNMQGKETRFGIVNSALWASATTAASNGSVNAMHDSFTPLGGMMPMWLMQLGEVILGGVDSGLYGMLMLAIVAVFIAGLMVGRTPEYLGKKIEAFEMKMASLSILIPCFFVLVGTAIAVAVEPGRAGAANPGAHGFSEILYAFSSAGNNNGSAFAGLSANTPFYNIALGIEMTVSRYWLANRRR